MSKITRAIPKEVGTGDEEEDIVIGAKVRRNFNADANNKKAGLKGHGIIGRSHEAARRNKASPRMCGRYQRP